MADDRGVNTEKNYVLSRDVAGTVRVHAQHYYLGKVQGFQLDPWIIDRFADKKDKIAIADAGAGSGIWASEVGALLGDRCFIEGYDISSAQFPHKSCVPDNVKLYGDVDLLAELDEPMKDAYDIVHTRFWTLIIQHDISPLIENLFRMLKPGGWIQFGDAYMDEHWIIYPDGIDPKSTKQGTQAVLDGARDFLNIMGIGGKSFEWQRNLDETFKKAGFVNYNFTFHRAPEPYASYNSDQLLVLGEELAKGALLMGKENGANEEAARRLLFASATAKDESLRGIHMNWTLFSIRAQRPLDS